jgi:hypothetical protein
MRYALRKQDKIKEVLGKEYLENNILQSLNKYFKSNNDAKTIRKAVLKTGYYGEVYRLLYYQNLK